MDSTSDASHPGLPLTGERTVPDVALERYWFLRHEAVYRWLPRWLPEHGLVLEAGCGEGYGADLLAEAGYRVLALDYDEEVVNHVRRRYPRVDALRVNLDRLPIAESSASAVVSLQVIEHLWDLPGFLAEAARVLAPEGVLVVSTPNRLTFSPGLARAAKPINPFHVEEFDAEQLVALLTAAGLREVSVAGVHHGPRIDEWEAEHGSIVAAHVAAVLSGDWDPAVVSLLPTLTSADFVPGPVEDALDLIGIGVR